MHIGNMDQAQQAAPRESQEGARLVDAFSSLSDQKRIIEEDLARMRERHIAFAGQNRITTVFGSRTNASVKPSR